MILAWSQTYTPLGGIGLSALIAAIPVLLLLGLLAFWCNPDGVSPLIAMSDVRPAAVRGFLR